MNDKSTYKQDNKFNIQQMQHDASRKNKEIAARAVSSSIEKIQEDIYYDNLSVRHNKLTPQKRDYGCQTMDVQQFSVHNLSRIDVNTASSKNQQSHIFQSKITNQTHKNINKESNADLSQRARQFVLKLKYRRKQIQGKFVLKKMQEQQRKKAKFHKEDMQKRVEQQIQKQVRKLRAQKNIQYYKEKQKLYNKSSSSLSPINQRGQSNSLRKQTLPSIYGTQLQQIKQEPTIRKQMKLTLDKTVLKNNKKRSHTVNDLRDDDDGLDNPNSQPRQIKLFDRDESRKNHREKFEKIQKSRKRQKQQQSSYYDDDKKSYLMSRNKTQDISMYIDKFSNVNQIRRSYHHLSDRKNGMRIMKSNNLERRQLMKSSTDRKDILEGEHEEDM